VSRVVKKVVAKDEPPKPLVKVEAPRRVFRVFECVVHLEQAAEHLSKVGIFPAAKADELKLQVNRLELEAKALAKTYRELWGAME
jgi:hypothetical protein